MNLYQLFIVFLKAGTLTFGGGQSIIPLLESELVERHHFMSLEDLMNIVALGNTLPGPIATKLSVAIGYDAAGIFGIFIALTATVLPSAIGIVLLFTLMNRFQDYPFVKGMQMAVRPVIIVMIFGVSLTMLSSTLTVLSLNINLNFIIILGLFIIALVVTILNEFSTIYISPIYLIILSILVGGLFYR